MGITVGANLTGKKGYQIKGKIMKMLEVGGKQFMRRAPKFFTKAGVPATNTKADSPGSNNCWVLDITNDVLYLVYNWVDEDDFDVVKVVE